MPLLTRKTQVALKHESAEGTAETLAAADAAFNIFEASFSADIEQFERNPFRNTIGTRTSIPGVKTGTVSFRTELVGNGSLHTIASPPAWGPALESCGFAVAAVKKLTVATSNITSGPFVAGETIKEPTPGFTGTVKAVSIEGSNTVLYVETSTSLPSDGSTVISGVTSGANFIKSNGNLTATAQGLVYSTTSTYSNASAPSATVGLFNDGVRHLISGARGNLTLSASTGQPVQMNFEFLGEKGSTADAGLFTGVAYPSTTPPTLLDANFTTHDLAAVLDNIEVNTNNDLQPRRSINDTGGITSCQIVSRQVQGSIDPEMTLVSTGAGAHDWFGKLDSNAEGHTQFTAGSSTHNKIIVVGQNSQYTGVSPADRNGIATVSVDLGFNESTNGDDDLQIVVI